MGAWSHLDELGSGFYLVLVMSLVPDILTAYRSLVNLVMMEPVAGLI